MADIVNRFSQISRFPIHEQYTDCNNEMTLILSVGNLSVSVSQPTGAGTTKKLLKHLACDLFVKTYH